MILDKAYNALKSGIADVRRNEHMAAHTSFKTGGPADIMVLPADYSELSHAMSTVQKFDLPLFVMGRGTNLLVTGKGIRGLVLKLSSYSGIEIDGKNVYAKSGTSLINLVKECFEHNLGGAEFLGGIPGSVGGAVYMNAGAYGSEIEDFVKQVLFYSPKGVLSLSNEEMKFEYRRSVLMDAPKVVTSVHLQLFRCDKEQSKAKLAELNAKRRQKQPLEYASAGSTFKRPKGGFAGTLIERTGLKGLKVGGAQVSEKHAGFIINKGNATPEDIIELIETVRRKVREATGILLEPEVRIIGER